MYSYIYNGDYYQSYGYIDDTFALTDYEIDEIQQVEKLQQKQLDMFKKKGRSK